MEHREETIAANVYTSLKKKIPQLVDALNGFVRSHHRFMLEQEYGMNLAYEKTIKNVEERIDQVLENYQEEVAVLDKLPGIDRKAAAVIIAEIGIDMTQFPSVEHLASWAGLCSGKRKSTHITKVIAYLKKVLCQAAFAASRSKNTKFKAHFYRIKQNRGTQKAVVATAHSLLKTIYTLLSTKQYYKEFREDYDKKKNVLEAS